MSDLALFWSYAHKDDDAVGGRIVQLGREIQSEYELQTGEPLELFIDKSSITWGEEWRGRIDSALAKTTFLVPVVTPRFLQSVECRREVIEFVSQAKSLGLVELVLPILYIKPPAFDSGPTEDDVTDLLRALHWIDWTDLRLSASDSEGYRRAVALMAGRIIAAIAKIETETAKSIATRDATPTVEDDDAPGLFELLAQAREAMTWFGGHLEEIAAATTALTAVITRYTPMINAASEPRGIVKILSLLAKDLDVPIQTIEQASSNLAQDMLEMDPGVMELIRLVAEGTIPATVENLASVRQLGALHATAEDAFEPIVSLADQVQGLSQISRELRRPFRRFSAALRQAADIRQVLARWRSEIERLLPSTEDAKE